VLNDSASCFLEAVLFSDTIQVTIDAVRAMRFQVGEMYDALKYIIDDI